MWDTQKRRMLRGTLGGFWTYCTAIWVLNVLVSKLEFTDAKKYPKASDDLVLLNHYKSEICCTIVTKSLWWRGHKGQTEYLFRYVFLMISIHPLACSLFVIITVTVVQQVRQGHREEGEVHGDPLGRTVHGWDYVLGVQGERGHVDWVPPGKSLLLVGLESYKARRRGVGALEEGMGRECGCPRVKINVWESFAKLYTLTLGFRQHWHYFHSPLLHLVSQTRALYHKSNFANEVVIQPMIQVFIYLLQGVSLVTALVQQAVSRVSGDQRASGVCMVNWAHVGSRAVRWGCRDGAQILCYMSEDGINLQRTSSFTDEHIHLLPS